MKKLISLGIVLSSLYVASAVNWASQSLLAPNGRNVVVTPQVPLVNWGDTNVLYQLYGYENVYSLTNNTGNTNITWPNSFGKADCFPSAIGMVSDDVTILVTLGNTNLIGVTNTQSITPPPYTTNLFPIFSTASTNVATITLAAMPDGTNACTTGTWAFTVTGNGLTPVVLKTNPPSAFLQGSRRIRIASISISTNTVGGPQGNGSGLLFNDIRFICPNP